MIKTDNEVFGSVYALHLLSGENEALTAEIGRLTAEVDILKAALKTIMQNAEFYDDEDDSLAVIYRVASKALTATAEKGGADE